MEVGRATCATRKRRSVSLVDEFALPSAPVGPPVPADQHALAVERPADPLDCGFLLSGGLLAPLPAKVRLPHEDDEGEQA